MPFEFVRFVLLISLIIIYSNLALGYAVASAKSSDPTLQSLSPEPVSDDVFSWNDYTHRFNVTENEAAADFLMDQIKKDTEGQISISLKSVLDEYEDGVNDSNWSQIYYKIINDLNNRGFPGTALTLLLFLDVTQMDESDLISYSAKRAEVYLAVGGGGADAIVWYQRALDIAFKIDAQNHIFSIFNSIANVFTQTKDFQNALRYIQFGKEMIEKGYRLEPIALARFLANAGIAYRRTGELEVAERLYLESIEISRLNNFQQLIAQNHANLGNLYKDKGDYESALMSYNISLEISQDINQLVGMVLNYINIGSAHRLMGIYEESRLALLKAEELLLKTSLSGFKRSLYSEFVLLGKETSNDAMRIKYERLFDEIDQEINSLDRQNDLLRNQQALYLQVIEREIAIQKARFRVTQLIHRMLIAVILFILASALAYNLFLRRKYRSLFNLYMDNLQAAERGGTPVMAVKEAKPFRTIRNKIVSTFNFSREKNEIISDTRGKTSHYFGHRGAGSESEDMLSATNDRDKERFEMMFEQILYLFKEEKIYIDTSLTLDSLSTKLGTNKKYVSTCINQKTALNFNKFVNSYRVEHVVRLMMNNTQGNLKLTQLYKMSGFRSKVTFYRTFKQFTGLTPVEFALQLRRNLPD